MHRARWLWQQRLALAGHERELGRRRARRLVALGAGLGLGAGPGRRVPAQAQTSAFADHGVSGGAELGADLGGRYGRPSSLRAVWQLGWRSIRGLRNRACEDAMRVKNERQATHARRFTNFAPVAAYSGAVPFLLRMDSAAIRAASTAREMFTMSDSSPFARTRYMPGYFWSGTTRVTMRPLCSTSTQPDFRFFSVELEWHSRHSALKFGWVGVPGAVRCGGCRSRSTSSTRKYGTRFHCEIACSVMPIRAANFAAVPTFLIARSSARSRFSWLTLKPYLTAKCKRRFVYPP